MSRRRSGLGLGELTEGLSMAGGSSDPKTLVGALELRRHLLLSGSVCCKATCEPKLMATCDAPTRSSGRVGFCQEGVPENGLPRGSFLGLLAVWLAGWLAN
jgi:hypothetical protein